MHDSVRALLTGIMDYAGLFPPAKLSMEDAIQNYARYRKGEYAWMLDRFICPVSRLHELDAHAGLFEEQPPFRFSLLPRKADSGPQFVEMVREDVDTINRFLDSCKGLVEVDVLELKLPDNVTIQADPAAIEALVTSTSDLMGSLDVQTVRPFFEASFTGSWEKNLDAVINGIAIHNEALSDSKVMPAGFKLRCGGVEPEAFPSAEQVAQVVSTARNHKVLMKATAGLHHPFRHDNEQMSVKEHGFFNLIGAVLIAYGKSIALREIKYIIADENRKHFLFYPDAFAWSGKKIVMDQIEEGRRIGFASYGSCSFEEPLEDLKDLGLLP
ncbi:hypothetical protein GF324_05980 [bacterium]|nr:hypothetical protein [bacterium]